MTKFKYSIRFGTNGLGTNGAYVVVLRLIDNKVKTFFMAGDHSKPDLERFMDSITDDLADGYFPKKGASEVDSLAYQKFSEDRHLAELSCRSSNFVDPYVESAKVNLQTFIDNLTEKHLFENKMSGRARGLVVHGEITEQIKSNIRKLWYDVCVQSKDSVPTFKKFWNNDKTYSLNH